MTSRHLPEFSLLFQECSSGPLMFPNGFCCVTLTTPLFLTQLESKHTVCRAVFRQTPPFTPLFNTSKIINSTVTQGKNISHCVICTLKNRLRNIINSSTDLPMIRQYSYVCFKCLVPPCYILPGYKKMKSGFLHSQNGRIRSTNRTPSTLVGQRLT